MGSKNKPRLPVVITRIAESPKALRPLVLEIPSGGDVVASLARFSRQKGLGLCLLSGAGAVSDVTLSQPEGTVVLRGRFDILSMSAAFLPAGTAAAAAGGVSVQLAGRQGQVIGGTVAGPVVAAGTVVVVVAAFGKSEVYRLTADGDDDAFGDGFVDGSVEGDGFERRHDEFDVYGGVCGRAVETWTVNARVSPHSSVDF